MPGFQTFLRFFASFCTGLKLATNSVRVNPFILLCYILKTSCIFWATSLQLKHISKKNLLERSLMKNTINYSPSNIFQVNVCFQSSIQKCHRSRSILSGTTPVMNGLRCKIIPSIDLVGKYKMMQKYCKITETLANGYSFESTQRELSNEYQHDWV